jgi:hypothetical protein
MGDTPEEKRKKIRLDPIDCYFFSRSYLSEEDLNKIAKKLGFDGLDIGEIREMCSLELTLDRAWMYIVAFIAVLAVIVMLSVLFAAG